MANQEKGIGTGREGSNIGLLFDNTSSTRLTLNSNNPWIQYKFTEEKQKSRDVYAYFREPRNR